MKNIAKLGLVYGITLMLGVTAYANMRLLIIDTPEILKNSTEGKEKTSVLQQEVRAREEVIKSLRNKLETQKKEYEEKELIWNAEVKAKKQKEVENTYVEFQKTVQKADRDMKERQNELMQPLWEKITKHAKSIASKENALLVIEKHTPGIIYYDTSARHITDEVINLLNAQYSSGGKAASAPTGATGAPPPAKK